MLAECRNARGIGYDKREPIWMQRVICAELIVTNGPPSVSQQAAEKALKALYQHLHMEAWGHVLTELLRELPKEITVDEALIAHAKQLDKNYIQTRYPNGFERGAPVDFYSANDADEAIAHAEAIFEFCQNRLR